jgi:spore maturation protein CgeB
MIIQQIKKRIPVNLKRIIKEKYNSMTRLRSIEVLSEEYIEKNIVLGKPLVLYVANRYDYGDPTRGLGYEHYNFYNTFLRSGYSFIYFDYDRITKSVGAKRMSRILREVVYNYQPEFLFYFHYCDLVDHLVWQEISNELSVNTIIYLADDFWRHEITRPVWSLFNVVVTLDKDAYNKRIKEGLSNVFLSQWGANSFIYHDLGLERKYDVSFVGQAYGNRPRIINILRKAGIKVYTFGRGWPNKKRIYQSDLIKIYNQSKIVFNISYSSRGNLAVNARDFEVPACGSLLLTHDIPNIYNYFMPGKEIVTYNDFDDAIEKIKYYLSHDKERKIIAKAGHERILRCHKYEKRFDEIFKIANKIGQKNYYKTKR